MWRLARSAGQVRGAGAAVARGGGGAGPNPEHPAAAVLGARQWRPGGRRNVTSRRVAPMVVAPVPRAPDELLRRAPGEQLPVTDLAPSASRPDELL